MALNLLQMLVMLNIVVLILECNILIVNIFPTFWTLFIVTWSITYKNVEQISCMMQNTT